ncbi:ABC transporter ATP-binding protein [Streptococcus ictaluri]|uniref:Ferrichrome ABC transporter, ATP-binding protein FhuC n=1 Tax=Streptococcus ictaluri 707-05 TaxID=764299 RepID=G5K1H0_9STRE|nr:ABC transporter ATP-binding protein [Streptococcus ictaluri]EHI70271.1 ferrichrome ABC transporter, ATP-binding protein FhuC [Streptococcus ictaluri 707-05]
MAIIRGEDLTISYGQKTIISDLSLELAEGKITTIIGANGCGKSTLLKALIRILPTTKGQVYLDGHDIATLSTKEVAKKMALLPQSQEAIEGTSVYELISYGRYPHQSYLGHLNQLDKDKIHWAMEATQVTAFANQSVDSLSGGQRQRVWIAMALAQDTDTIFLDEPTTYLDINHQLEILDLLKNLNQTSGKTLIMVLHDLNLSARYSDMLIAMKEGKILNSGSVREIMTPQMIRDLFHIQAQVVEDPIHHCPILLTYQLI